MVSSTCFEHPSVHPQEDLYMQFCMVFLSCLHISCLVVAWQTTYTGGANKSLARPGRKQARKHVRGARDFNNIETSGVINIIFLQGKAPKEIHAILTETLACFPPGRAKDLSAFLYKSS